MALLTISSTSWRIWKVYMMRKKLTRYFIQKKMKNKCCNMMTESQSNNKTCNLTTKSMTKRKRKNKTNKRKWFGKSQPCLPLWVNLTRRRGPGWPCLNLTCKMTPNSQLTTLTSNRTTILTLSMIYTKKTKMAVILMKVVSSSRRRKKKTSKWLWRTWHMKRQRKVSKTRLTCKKR